MLGVVATIKVEPGMERYVDRAAVDAHRATDYFKALGRKMGEAHFSQEGFAVIPR